MRSASPLPGHFTSTMRTTGAGTSATLMWPPVSRSTSCPASSSPAISGMASFCSSGSPPVSSTSGQPSAATRARTSSTAIFWPPVKA